MAKTVMCSAVARYTVSELSAFGQVRIAGEFEAENDGEALRLARHMVP